MADRELIYRKTDDGATYECTYGCCGWSVDVADIKSGEFGPNILQDHAHTHQALSVKVTNSSTPIECEIVQK